MTDNTCRTCGTKKDLMDYDGDSYICKPCCDKGLPDDDDDDESEVWE